MYKVLIADDEMTVRKGLVSFIDWQKLDCTVCGEAENGLDALDMVRRLSPQILISDIRMPGLDGLALVRALHEEESNIQVILLTGYADFEYAQAALRAGVSDFVLKPTSSEEIVRAVEQAKLRYGKLENTRTLRDKLQQEQHENTLLRQNIFLGKLLGAQPLSMLYAMEEMARLRLNPREYFLVELDIDREEWEQQRVKDDLEKLKNCIAVVCSGTQLRIIEHSEQTLYLLLAAEDSSTPLGIERVTEMCEAVLHMAATFSVLTLAAGISRRHSDLTSLTEAREQAHEAAMLAAYGGAGGSVVAQEHIPRMDATSLQEFKSYLRCFDDALSRRDYAAAEETVRHFLHFCRERHIPLPDVCDFSLILCGVCLEMLWEHQPAEDEALAHRDYAQQLVQSRSTEDIREVFHSMISRLTGLAVQSEGRRNEVIAACKSYIDFHYAEELTLEHLADVVHFSPSHLSRIFKREVGENLSSYIQRVRIDKAKQLLAQPGVKTYEVAEAVGIGNPVYFSKLFKKYTGQRPKEYREGRV